MHFTTVAFLALAATAQSARFYRAASPFEFGLFRRDDGAAYEPDVTECGEGETCAEACGAGHEQCPTDDDVAFCYQPGAGQTCCGAKASSCETGFFCACDTKDTSVCCAQGLSLTDCAADHEDVDGALTSDPAAEPTSSAEPTTESTATESTAEPTASATWPSNNGTITTGGPTATGGAPTPTPSDEVPGAAAGVAPFTAAALLVVGAVAAML